MKKKRKTRPWWQQPKTVRTIGIWAAVLAVLGAGAAWFAISATRQEEAQYVVDTAPAFQLPTIDAGTYASSEHLGKHNMLLYFNEGMG